MTIQQNKEDVLLKQAVFDIGDAIYDYKFQNAQEFLKAFLETNSNNSIAVDYYQALFSYLSCDFENAYKILDRIVFIDQQMIPELCFWKLSSFYEYIESRDNYSESYKNIYNQIRIRLTELIQSFDIRVPESQQCRYNTAISEMFLWLGDYRLAYKYISRANVCEKKVLRTKLVLSKVLDLTGHWPQSKNTIEEVNTQLIVPEFLAWEARIRYIHRKEKTPDYQTTIAHEKQMIKSAEVLLKKALEELLKAGDSLRKKDKELRGKVFYQYACMLQEEAYLLAHNSNARYIKFRKAKSLFRKASRDLCMSMKDECNLALAQCLIEMARAHSSAIEEFTRLKYEAARILNSFQTFNEHGENRLNDSTIIGQLAGQQSRFIGTIDEGAIMREGVSDAVGDHIVSIMDNREMRDLERKVFENKERGREFLKEWYRNEKYGPPVLHILQRWNSFTPILGDSKGGGYFFDTGYSGLAIDPGFDFIKNFKEEHFYFGQIDSVLISHAHNDHAADLESILTLLYKHNEAIKGDMYVRFFSNSISRQILNYTDLHQSIIEFNTTLEEIFSQSNRKKKLSIYMTLSVFKKYLNIFNLEINSLHCLKILDDYSQKDKIEIDGITKLVPVRANHDDQISKNQCKGFLMMLRNIEGDYNDFWLLYTGDTGFSPSLINEYKRISDLAKENEKPLILLAHIGGFSHRERYHYWEASCTGGFYEKAYYPTHLGRLGLVQVINNTETALIVISEWGEEFEGKTNGISNRKRLCDILSENQPDFDIIAGDIGLSVTVLNGEVRLRADETKKEEWQTESIKTENWSLYNEIEYVEECGALIYKKRV